MLVRTVLAVSGGDSACVRYERSIQHVTIIIHCPLNLISDLIPTLTSSPESQLQPQLIVVGGHSSGGDGGTTAAPEDRYHLNSKPAKIDPFTGLPSRQEEPVDEDEELPEDRFHRCATVLRVYVR